MNLRSASRDSSAVPFLALAMTLAALIFTTARPGRGDEPNPLYMAVPITTGSDTRFRADGFAKALREVMVKLTGEPRLFNDARIKLMSVHAENLVASFSYVDKMVAYFHHDDQGTYDRPHDLTVHFDTGKVDATLAEMGENKWTDDRPVVVPLIAVRGPANAYLLTSGIPQGAAMRGSLTRAGIIFGLKVRIPRSLDLAGWGLALDRAMPAIASTSTEARVYGTLEFKDTAPIGWTTVWRMRWDGSDYAWGVKGVSFDAAFDSLVGGVARVASGHGAPD
jgi:hypothetical protein